MYNKIMIISISITMMIGLSILLFIVYVVYEMRKECETNLNQTKIIFCDGYKCKEEIKPNEENQNDEIAITISTYTSRKSMEKD